MSVRDELRDPWGWLVAGVAGGLGWAVLAPVAAPGAVMIGVGIGAAVLGAKVAMGVGTGTGRQQSALDEGGEVRPDDLPRPDPSSPAGRLLARGQGAVARITQLSEAPGDPWLRDQVSDVDDEASQALEALAIVGGRVTLVEQSMVGSDPARLASEKARLDATVQAATDPRLRAETERAVAAVGQQQEVAARLATLRDTLLARMETAVIGLEGLAARMGEVVALGATAIEHDRARDLVDGLTGELEGVRTGLDEASRLAAQE